MEQTQINVSQLTEIELKAFAYDELNKLETAKNNLRIINQELANRQAAANLNISQNKPQT